MEPFWSGMAIGIAVGLPIFLLCLVICMLRASAAFAYGLSLAMRDAWRKDRAQAAAIRGAHGLPTLSAGQAARVALKRTWRILRHPLRERAFIAESWRALRNPLTHHWSDGLS